MITSLVWSLLDLLRPRNLLLVLVVPLLTFIAWVILGIFVVPMLAAGLSSWAEQGAAGVPWIESWAASLGFGATVLIAILLLFPLVFWTSLLVMSWVALPWILLDLKSRYPQAPKTKGSFWASLWVFVSIFSRALPLYVLGFLVLGITGFFPIYAFVLTAWVNAAFLSAEILSEFVDSEIAQNLRKESRWSLLIMGAGITFLMAGPLLQLAAPLLAGLWFSHYWLGKLSRRRSP